MIDALLWLFSAIVQLIIIVMIVNAVLSWLIAFQIVNPYRNAFVRQVWDMAQRLTDPLLRPIRKVIPSLGGMDLSPIVLVLGLLFLERVLYSAAAGQLL